MQLKDHINHSSLSFIIHINVNNEQEYYKFVIMHIVVNNNAIKLLDVMTDIDTC